MTSAISETVSFLRQNDLKTILARIRERNVPGLVQFAVYSMCGGLATVIFLGTVIGLSKTLLPAYEGMTVENQPVRLFGRAIVWLSNRTPGHGMPITTDAAGDDIRALNLLINNCIAFLAANVVAYVTNILFVFKTGRHHPVVEFFFFTLVSGVAFAISQIAGPWLVSRFGVPTNVAILTNVVASMLLNFAGRKFFVFKG